MDETAVSDDIIDGVGNDVTILITCIVVGISIVFAWRSTHVQQIENQHTHYHSNTSQRDTSENSTHTPSETQSSEASTTTSTETSGSTDGQDVSPPPPSSSSTSDNQDQSNTEPSSSTSDSSASEPREQFSLKLKFLDDTQQLIKCSNRDKISDLRHNFPSETAHRYRLIFGGQVLRDDRTLEQYGIRRQLDADNSEIIPVIHCFLSNTPEPARQAPTSASEQVQQNVGELHIGHFFLPLLGSMLTMLWYICIFHTSLFTVPSIFGIVGLTCFYAIILVNRFL